MRIIFQHLGMLALCVLVPAAIVCSPALVDNLSIALRTKKRVKHCTAAENTLPPTLTEEKGHAAALATK